MTTLATADAPRSQASGEMFRTHRLNGIGLYSLMTLALSLVFWASATRINLGHDDRPARELVPTVKLQKAVSAFGIPLVASAL